MLRCRGRILPWRNVINCPPLTGDLRVEECHDDQLRRYVRTASLFNVNAPVFFSEAPRLFDVRLMGMSTLAFSLTGFERLEGVEYAQSWLVDSANTSLI
jgi:hypothetical protein